MYICYLLLCQRVFLLCRWYQDVRGWVIETNVRFRSICACGRMEKENKIFSLPKSGADWWKLVTCERHYTWIAFLFCKHKASGSTSRIRGLLGLLLAWAVQAKQGVDNREYGWAPVLSCLLSWCVWATRSMIRHIQEGPAASAGDREGEVEKQRPSFAFLITTLFPPGRLDLWPDVFS